MRNRHPSVVAAIATKEVARAQCVERAAPFGERRDERGRPWLGFQTKNIVLQKDQPASINDFAPLRGKPYHIPQNHTSYPGGAARGYCPLNEPKASLTVSGSNVGSQQFAEKNRPRSAEKPDWETKGEEYRRVSAH